MKRIVLLAMAIMLSWTIPTAAGDAEWFDFENCDFCKNMTTDKNLLNNLTWEHHKISNGILSITTVKDAYKKAYEDASAAMAKLGGELASGARKIQDVTMCGHCQHYGELLMAGAKFEDVQGEFASVVLITSDKPETVAMIQEYGARTNTEFKKWMTEHASK